MARSGSPSQASTAVHAPRCTTTSGDVALVACNTTSRSVTSSAPWSAAITSSPHRSHSSTSSRPTWPPAPVTKILIGSSWMLQRSPPPLVAPVPVHGLLECFVERAPLPPTQLGDLGDVDGVAPIVTEAVLHVLDHLFPHVEEGEQLVDEQAVGGLVAGTDVVDLARRTLVKRQQHTGAMVVHVQPVALVQAVAVQGDALAFKQVGREQRDCLLGVLV